jgi:ubiquinone/menaquinone biosynthesis C-methylase UbiE
MNAPLNTSTELQAAKAEIRRQWDAAASGWDRHTSAIREWLRTPTRAMLSMAGIGPGSRVLDVAAGAGDQTLDIAERVGPDGAVVATDLSSEILLHAERRVQQARLHNVQTRVADAEHLPHDIGLFDAVVCRLGLMLFPDPLHALKEMYRVLKAGGGVCTVVFSTPEHNPCVAMLMQTALRHAGRAPAVQPQPGSLFSLAAPGRLESLFEAAGFVNVATTVMDAPFRLPSARHYIDFVRASASPIQQILSPLDAAAQQRAWEEMEERLQVFATGGQWVGPNELRLTAGRR